MIVGVTEGFKKELDVNGVGYRVAKEGNKLVMNLGFSHQVIVEEIEGITIEVPSAQQDRHQRHRQAEGRPVRRRSAREASARAVQGQGHQIH